jgi:hypothetical protein
MECYICLENEGKLYKSGNCNCSLVFHKECFSDLIDKSDNNKYCSVCKKDYIITEKVLSKNTKLDLKFLLILMSGYIIRGGLLSLSIFLFIKILYNLILILSIVLLISSILLSLFIHLCLYHKYSRCCLITEVKKDKNIEIQLIN